MRSKEVEETSYRGWQRERDGQIGVGLARLIGEMQCLEMGLSTTEQLR